VRGVEEKELTAAAGTSIAHAPVSAKVLSGDNLADIFGLDLAQEPSTPAKKPKKRAKGHSGG
jgi:hypothetical protein